MASKSGWVIGFFSDAVHREMRKQPDLIRADFDYVSAVIEEEGLPKLPRRYIKQLKGEDNIWEIRLTGKNTIARALYLQRLGNRVIILCVFTKKSQKIPKHILQLARKRAKEIRNA